MPLPWVLGQVFDEAIFNDLVEQGFLARGRWISGHLENRPVSFLGSDSDREVVVSEKGMRLVACGFNAATW